MVERMLERWVENGYKKNTEIRESVQDTKFLQKSYVT